MSHQHNPIAHLITKIQQHWRNEISADPACRVVRWLIDPAEVRLYQGFLQLETSKDGDLPEMIVAQLTAVHSADTFSAAVATTWLEAYERDKTFAGLQSIAPLFQSTNIHEYYAQPVGREKDLADLLSTFKTTYLKDRTLVLALMPVSVSSTGAFERWIRLMNETQIPDGIVLVAFIEGHNTALNRPSSSDSPIIKTVSLTLHLEESIRKIALAGDPLNPETHLRQFIFKMSTAVQRRNPNELKTTAAACINYQIRCGSMASIATAHIIYAGMLFNFKPYNEIEKILNNGLRFASRGHQSGDISCKPLMVQFYGYLAACCHLNNKGDQAICWYQQQALCASSFGLHLQAIAAWQQAAALAQNTNRRLHLQILQQAFEFSQQIPIEEIMHSDFHFIGLALYNRLQEQKEYSRADDINNRMTAIYGSDWEQKCRQKAGAGKSKEANLAAGAV